MAEWLNALVLKTKDLRSVGSNPTQPSGGYSLKVECWSPKSNMWVRVLLSSELIYRLCFFFLDTLRTKIFMAVVAYFNRRLGFTQLVSVGIHVGHSLLNSSIYAA